MNSEVKVTRRPHLAEKVVFIEGQPGCGKTMLAPIVAAMDRVELLTYAYQLEHICALHYLNKLDLDSAAAQCRLLTDLQLYNTMMGRETNFRLRDLSGVFRDRPWRYFKRVFQKGDEAVVNRVKQAKPILSLTAHNFLEISEPVFAGLGDRAVVIEVIRHPLYMLKQQALNMDRLLNDVRFFTLNIEYNGQSVPFWTRGWEDLFLRSNAMEKVIYAIKQLTERRLKAKKSLQEKYGAKIITVPFEEFVLKPWPMLEEIVTALGSQVTSYTRKVMRKQCVPRKMIGQGVNLKIYERCGFEQPKSGDQTNEYELRRQHAAETASAEAMRVLDQLCAEYDERYFIKEEK